MTPSPWRDETLESIAEQLARHWKLGPLRGLCADELQYVLSCLYEYRRKAEHEGTLDESTAERFSDAIFQVMGRMTLSAEGQLRRPATVLQARDERQMERRRLRGLRIHRLPGSRLAGVLSLLLTARAYKRMVRPWIADAQKEYREAVERRQERRARWIAVRLYLIVCPSWVYEMIAGVIRRLLGLT